MSFIPPLQRKKHHWSKHNYRYTMMLKVTDGQTDGQIDRQTDSHQNSLLTRGRPYHWVYPELSWRWNAWSSCIFCRCTGLDSANLAPLPQAESWARWPHPSSHMTDTWWRLASSPGPQKKVAAHCSLSLECIPKQEETEIQVSGHVGKSIFIYYCWKYIRPFQGLIAQWQHVHSQRRMVCVYACEKVS